MIKNYAEASKLLAEEILTVATANYDSSHTVLVPGCNTPQRMYQELAMMDTKQGGKLKSLLTSIEDNFFLGMIDGTETQTIDDSSGFPYYFKESFLLYLDKECHDLTTEDVYKKYQHVVIPWLPTNATPDQKSSYLDTINEWYARQHVDLVVCGLGPTSDGHIFFLNGKNINYNNTQYFEEVQLWPEIQDWKWQQSTKHSSTNYKLKPNLTWLLQNKINCDEGACQTANGSCLGQYNVPEYAITMTPLALSKAKKVIVLAFGQKKAEAVHNLVNGVNGRYSSSIFTAHLLYEYVQGELIFMFDEAASSKLI